MAAFDYLALDAKGKETRGIIEGDGAKQVRQILRDRGLMPLEITESIKKAQGKQGSGIIAGGLRSRCTNNGKTGLVVGGHFPFPDHQAVCQKEFLIGHKTMVNLLLFPYLGNGLLQVRYRQLRQGGVVVGYILIALPEAVAFAYEHGQIM